ncbi:MAG TPA: DUF3810 domain-containing protein [Ruminococcus sp.]|nr:DUF3810 domain-containing protein [Ruminococcus sp.]
MRNSSKSKSKYWSVLLVLLAVTVIMNALGFWPAFCDWYTDHIYPYIADGLGWATAQIPFNLGEILMYLGIVLVLLAVIFLLLLIFLRKKQGYRRFAARYFQSLLMTLVCVVFWYSFCWSVPFRGTVLGQQYEQKRRDFTYEEICALMQYCVDGANAAAEAVVINPDGSVDFPTEAENRTKIEQAMLNLADEFPRLRGYYPPVKTAYCSDVLDRMSIGGYTYPCTMELTHSKYSAADPVYQPLLDAHELSHHMGYYKENEANFLSQLALIQSDDPFLRIAGFDDFCRYVSGSYYEAREDALMAAAQQQGVTLPSLDDIDLHTTPKEVIKARIEEINEAERRLVGEPLEIGARFWHIVNAAYGIREEVYAADPHPIDDMPVVNEAIEQTADVGWSAQAEILQENTYDGVTLLLLQFFDGKLY